jgi:Response regulator containing CheY-like receiver, AAA-type ATPase, and DNA-binding domains
MRRCLIVDDSSVIRKVARSILESMKYEVIEAEDGQKALDRCHESAVPHSLSSTGICPS